MKPLFLYPNQKIMITKINQVHKMNGTPMIRIMNKYLEKYGFKVGDKFKVTYSRNTILIKKIVKDERV